MRQVPASDFAVGDVIAGKYEVRESLGQGGMGVVLAAHHRQLDKRVALKFLLPEAATRPEACERFLREARNATRLKSAHAVQVYDVDTHDGKPFLVMEYLEGRDLARVLRERGPLPTAQAVDWMLQVCEAMADAHEQGVVHRDLKPANLFVTQARDGSTQLKVLDFGISKSVLEDGAVTANQGRLGSAPYMAPERVWAGRKWIRARMCGRSG